MSMCNVCTEGVVGRVEGEDIHCNYCAQGLGARLNRMDETLISYVASLRRLDASERQGKLDREGLAWRDAIQEEHARLSAEYDRVESKFKWLANPGLAKLAAA